MKRLLLLALFAATAASAKAPAERWLDPECFEVGRAPMRTSFIVFPTASEAVPENDYTRSPFYRTLNGEWAFLRAERPGRFSALPAVIEAMYAPELRGNSREHKIGISMPVEQNNDQPQ